MLRPQKSAFRRKPLDLPEVGQRLVVSPTIGGSLRCTCTVRSPRALFIVGLGRDQRRGSGKGQKRGDGSEASPSSGRCGARRAWPWGEGAPVSAAGWSSFAIAVHLKRSHRAELTNSVGRAPRGGGRVLTSRGFGVSRACSQASKVSRR